VRMAHRSLKIGFIAAWAILFVVGAVAEYERITNGLEVTALTSYVAWGLWIAGDIYFSGLSAGAFLISSLAYGFKVKVLEPIGKLALYTALVMLISALILAWNDIGQMTRLYEIFTRPNFSSILNDIVWLYAVYFLVLLAELLLVMRQDLLRRPGRLSRLLLLGRTHTSAESLLRDRKVLTVLAIGGVFLAIIFEGGLGALFSTLIARPYWYGPLYPIYFIVGALASGAALLTALVVFLRPVKDEERHKDVVVYLGRFLLIVALGDLLLEIADLTAPTWYGIGDALAYEQVVLFGPYWYVFWIGHVLLGLAIPLSLLILFSRKPKMIGLAGALYAVAYFAVRLNIVIPGYVLPLIPGLQYAYIDPRLLYTYFPSLDEWGVLLFVVMLGFGLFFLGYRTLPLRAGEVEFGPQTPIELPKSGSVEEKKDAQAPYSAERREAIKTIGEMALVASVAGVSIASTVRKKSIQTVASALMRQEPQTKVERNAIIQEAQGILRDLVEREGVASGNTVSQDKLIAAANKPTTVLLPNASTVTTKIDPNSSGWSQPYQWEPGQPTIQVPSEPISGEEDPIGRMMQDLARALKKPANQRKWGMVIDLRKCSGCYACTVACKAENKEPPGVEYRPVIVEEYDSYPNVSMSFLPRPCMQCDDPPCVPVCPVGATFIRPDGIVAIDYDVCIGCRYCVTACPYQARTFDWGLYYTEGTPQVEPYETLPSFEYGGTWERPVKGTDSPKFNTRKCHFCLHRLESGMLPACVTTCLGRATYFGDLNDPDSYVSQLIREQGVSRLKEELGTDPKVYYIGLTEPTESGRPVEG